MEPLEPSSRDGMATWKDIRDGVRLEEAIITVVDARFIGNDHLAWRLVVRDDEGQEFRFDVWTAHDVGVDWKTGHRYVIEETLGKVWNNGRIQTRKLSSTRDLQVTDLGPIAEQEECTLLVMSDTHIGYKHRDSFERPWQGHADGLASFRRATRLAIDLDVDGVIHAGDIFDDIGVPTDREIEQVGDILLELGSYHHIPFYYITGNHENPGGLELLDFLSPSGDSVHLTPDGLRVGKTNIVLYGIDYHRPPEFHSDLSFGAAPLQSTKLLVLHQDLSPVRPGGDVNLDQFVSVGPSFDYIISGDLHDAEVHSWNDTHVLYPGSTADISKKSSRSAPSAWRLTVRDGEIEHDRYHV